MKMIKKAVAILCLLAMVLPVSAAEPMESPALPPLTVGIKKLSEIPENWNLMQDRNADQNAILELTAEPLYRVHEGTVIAAQASALPVDVTAEFAGCYQIPTHATRGYAYAIEIRDKIFWEDGKELTLFDWLYTIEIQSEMNVFPLEIANHRAYLRGDTAPAEEIISLLDAGYDSVGEAESAGITDFYVDTTYFWGLDTGWLRYTDRTKLHDEAIPSGCEEMYITPAYLYREYLGENGTQTMFQSEFVGIPVQSGEKMTIDEVGLFVDGDRLILVLQQQTTATHLALVLSDVYPVPQGTNAANYGTAIHYMSCGPYRIEYVTDEEILLTPNPYWTGAKTAYEQVSCRAF